MVKGCEGCPRIEGCPRTGNQLGVVQVPGEHHVIVGMCVPRKSVWDGVLQRRRYEWVDFSDPKVPEQHNSPILSVLGVDN